jgi:citrate lyase beta subunit
MSDELWRSFRAQADDRLADVDALLSSRFGGDSRGRQPVHTCYIPADRYHRHAHREWGDIALDALTTHGKRPRHFAHLIDADVDAIEEIWPALLEKLQSEPIEDLRVDFEDGYGRRDDSEEDDHVAQALESMCTNATPFIGARIKSFEAVTRDRALATLDQLVSGLARHGFPDEFVITLPKVSAVEQVEVMADACATLEKQNSLKPGSLHFEIQIEMPQAIIGPDGSAPAARFIDAADGRLTAFHYGTYDYSAAVGISAAFQTLDHPAADFAKSMLQVVTAQTGVRLSDGSTNIIPIGDAREVEDAWRNHYRLVRRSLARGIYQGWDLHGAQLPTRFAAVFTFYREHADKAAERLRAYLDRAESGTMDEPATAIALAGYFLRGVDAGAITNTQLEGWTGQTTQLLRALVRRKGQLS